MVLFNTLKPIISAACKISNFDSKDIEDRYKFELNLKQLEENINKADSTFHILAVIPDDGEATDADILHSKSLTYEDITNIMEYIHKPKEIESFVTDKVNYVEFMIYCTDIKNEEYKINVLKHIINDDGSTEHLAYVYGYEVDPLVTNIISHFPIYKVLVMRKFNFKKDKFIYNIVFRSNYEMIEYVNNNFSKKKEEVAIEDSKED